MAAIGSSSIYKIDLVHPVELAQREEAEVSVRFQLAEAFSGCIMLLNLFEIGSRGGQWVWFGSVTVHRIYCFESSIEFSFNF